MKPVKGNPPQSHKDPKHPAPLGSQQAVAEKAADSNANVKARVDSQNLPDKPDLHRQHTQNSSGRK